MGDNGPGSRAVTEAAQGPVDTAGKGLFHNRNNSYTHPLAPKNTHNPRHIIFGTGNHGLHPSATGQGTTYMPHRLDKDEPADTGLRVYL